MNRRVEPEILDDLPPADPRAIHSRRDLRRINAWMGNGRTLGRIMENLPFSNGVHRIVELGAGDGTFMLRLAARMARRWKSVEVLLVDRQEAVTEETMSSFQLLGWKPTFIQMDVLAWLRAADQKGIGLMMANLFLHHFREDDLRELFHHAAERTQSFLACEPRRCALALGASRLLGLIGCNRVTRHDAILSVRAGFDGQHLSRLWPNSGAWHLIEKRIGAFAHCFVAVNAHQSRSEFGPVPF